MRVAVSSARAKAITKFGRASISKRTVDGKILSRHTANAVLKQAGLEAKAEAQAEEKRPRRDLNQRRTKSGRRPKREKNQVVQRLLQHRGGRRGFPKRPEKARTDPRKLQPLQFEKASMMARIVTMSQPGADARRDHDE
jgi:hypothetical protein